MDDEAERERIRLKLEKRARKATKRAAQEQRAPAPPPLPSDVPIIWVEPTGEKFYRGTWKCENGHYQRLEIETFEIPAQPIPCDQCALEATGWSAGANEIFRRPDTGETFRGWDVLPIGACYDQAASNPDCHNWVSGKTIKSRPGADGRVLVVILPDRHPWTIDSRARNCTLPDDDKHWCWVRSGKPEDGTLDVGKGGRTCSAGAGSIATSRYHGFLRKGRLISC